MTFPLDTSAYQPLSLDPLAPKLTGDQRAQLAQNIQVVRDTIVFFTAVSGARGFGGHTGGAYDIVPEVLIADGFMRGSDWVYPLYFDAAGHRVAIQYAMAAFNGELDFERLLHYREAGYGLYGHPEIDLELGIKFASGRLGHLWAFVNGVARANPDKTAFVFSSDGSQMEGNEAEAARLAVAHQLNVKLCIDDNNVTISGHPAEYLPGFNIDKTLKGQGLSVDVGDPEDLDALYQRMQRALNTPGPVALVNRRPMAPGLTGIEGSTEGHDVIPVEHALTYLRQRNHLEAVAYLESRSKNLPAPHYPGSTAEYSSNRGQFGAIVNGILEKLSPEERQAQVLVVDADLEGSTGLQAIGERFPEVYVKGGVQERGGFSLAAGFGFEAGKQGIFSTFSAFLEMIISEATMARLNRANVLCHFSHAGVDYMADNTCHYGINLFMANSGLADDPHIPDNRLYFPADVRQFKAVIERIWDDPGLRFVFSTRSKVPNILKEDGSPFYDDSYVFEPGRDELIREGSAGYVVSYGELTFRALAAVEMARREGLDVGLVHKPTLNLPDEAMLKRLGEAPFVLLVESQNAHTGLGIRFGTWLLQRGYHPGYDFTAITKPGDGGITEHIAFHQLDPDSILSKIKAMGG